MKRRTLVLGTATVGLAVLAGCIGNETDGTDDAIDNMSDTDDDGRIDPAAHYVIEGPEGLFSAKGPWNTDLDGVVIHGYDLVTYFEEERPVQGSPAHEYDYDGATFRFSSESNAQKFANDPETYLPEFGGYCSLGVGNGYKDGMHPEAFDVLDGKLYFNLTPGIHEGWLRNYEERIETAEENWPEIKDSTDPLHIGPGL